MPAPFLHLQRRHGRRCSARFPVDSLTNEADERRRGVKRCTCPIFASGTLAGVFRKMGTRAQDWEEARRTIAPYLAADSWDQTPNPPGPKSHGPIAAAGDSAADQPAMLPISEAIRQCLAEHESADNTIKKYRLMLGEFERFSAHLGLRYIQEWEGKTNYVRQFRDSWNVGPTTKPNKLGLVKAFFEIFVEDGVLKTNPARIKSRRNRALRAPEEGSRRQKNPFTDDELRRMLDGCAHYGRTELRRWPKKQGGRQVVAITEYREYHRQWTGDDLADFIHVSLYTGLRISDVATFHISRLNEKNEVRLRRIKNGTWVSLWIPEWLAIRIRDRGRRIGPLIFGEHQTTDINVITDVWRRKLKALWKQTEPWAQKTTHHRFRHTFVRILLERGVPVATIAELTGDTEAIIRKHYSAWMPKRQENLSQILREAFQDTPRLHG